MKYWRAAFSQHPNSSHFVSRTPNVAIENLEKMFLVESILSLFVGLFSQNGNRVVNPRVIFAEFLARAASGPTRPASFRALCRGRNKIPLSADDEISASPHPPTHPNPSQSAAVRYKPLEEMAAQSKVALPPWGNALAGALGAVFANTCVYPLDM